MNIISTKTHHKSNIQHGFTLVDLLVTISIMAIIATIAIPAFTHLLQSMEAKQIHNLISDAIRLARSESYIHHQNVVLCLANNANECHKNANDKLIVFIDGNDNHHFDITETMLSSKYLNLDFAHTYLRAGGRSYVKFFGDSGLPRGHFGHIKYCPSSIDNDNIYLVSFNQQGIIRYKPNTQHNTDCPS